MQGDIHKSKALPVELLTPPLRWPSTKATGTESHAGHGFTVGGGEGEEGALHGLCSHLLSLVFHSLYIIYTPGIHSQRNILRIFRKVQKPAFFLGTLRIRIWALNGSDPNHYTFSLRTFGFGLGWSLAHLKVHNWLAGRRTVGIAWWWEWLGEKFSHNLCCDKHDRGRAYCGHCLAALPHNW